MTNYAEDEPLELEPQSPDDLDFALGYSEDRPERIATIGLAAVELETSADVSDEDNRLYHEVWQNALAMMPSSSPGQQGVIDV